ncbi:hypothetical protein COO60DRAFT_1016014 [Scenedesmus sp. NREL 46B-D3]|nr:hypothetical protein COO60DRAFT_1016014 [Scenedesmus sp. NREL 46B-D3]
MLLAGFLLPYHLGVYQALAVMGLVDASTPMAGSSAGSLVVASIKAGLSLQQQMDSFLEAAADCRQGGVAGRLRAVLKAQLQRSLPHDAHTRCSDGSCWLSITQVLPRPANKLYGAFPTRQALIKALLTSCHLPRLSDGSIFTSFKSIHKRCFDGGFSNLVPVPPAPPPAFCSTGAPAAAVGGLTASIAAAGSAEAEIEAMPALLTAAGVGQLQPTAPAAALARVDSTKGISTQLQTGRNNSSSSRDSSSSQHHLRMASSSRHATRNKARSGNGHHSGVGLSSSSSSTAGDGHGVCAGARLVPADGMELPVELRMARRDMSEQQQQQQVKIAGVRREQQQQQQQEATAMAVAEAGAEEAAGVAVAARQST